MFFGVAVDFISNDNVFLCKTLCAVLGFENCLRTLGTASVLCQQQLCIMNEPHRTVLYCDNNSAQGLADDIFVT